MPDSELLKLTISEVAPLIQAGEVSPVELTRRPWMKRSAANPR